MYLYGVVVVTLSRGMRRATEVDGDGRRDGRRELMLNRRPLQNGSPRGQSSDVHISWIVEPEYSFRVKNEKPTWNHKTKKNRARTMKNHELNTHLEP